MNRERKPRKSPSKKRPNKQKKVSITEWLLKVCKNADFFLDEAACINPNEATLLLPAIDAAIEGLIGLRKRIQQRTDVA